MCFSCAVFGTYIVPYIIILLAIIFINYCKNNRTSKKSLLLTLARLTKSRITAFKLQMMCIITHYKQQRNYQTVKKRRLGKNWRQRQPSKICPSQQTGSCCCSASKKRLAGGHCPQHLPASRMGVLICYILFMYI